MKKIYIAEDDADIRELEAYALQNSGFQVESFSDGAALERALERMLPDLVLLDIMLPGESGLDVLKKLREDRRTRELPVILVTAKSSEMDTVRGLDMGADDYLAKPFGIMELVSRVKARTRKAPGGGTGGRLSCGGIVMDEASHTITADGQPCDLTHKEYELLRLLLCHPGAALGREVILNAIWGYQYEGSSRTLDMHIKTLRQKLGRCGAQIQTVRGVGYRLGTEG